MVGTQGLGEEGLGWSGRPHLANKSTRHTNIA